MENVWNIREDKNLYYILTDKAIGTERNDYSNVAIIAYIYYEDTIDQYLEYIKCVPNEIAVFLISSNDKTLEALLKFALNRNNIRVIKKKNRGRDISAFLISSREIFQKYTYVCFIHDKKAKSKEEQRQIDFWIENLWGNTLKSAGYIKNVLQVLEDNSNVGLLVPPEPYVYMQSKTFWYIEYERTKELASELGLTNTIIEKEYPPITLGTVFWCRTCVMKKLFDRQWQFEDFVDEPMPGEGTVSHAIERVLAYLAQDAGYDTGTIMSEEYAKKLLMALQHEKKAAYNMLADGMNISNPLSLWKFYIRKEQIKKYVEEHSEIYLFGAGKIGKMYLTAFREIIGCTPRAFIVTGNKLNKKNIGDIPIISFETLDINPSMGIIISVGESLKDEIKKCLISKKYNEYLYILDLPEDSHLM